MSKNQKEETMRLLTRKLTVGILLLLTVLFQYSCKEPQPVEQTPQKNTSQKLALSVTPVYGAIFTTDGNCTGVNLNIYQNKTDVYLDGGPDHPGAAGLPDGNYYCKITDPSGNTLLGTSVGLANPTPIHVTNGEFDNCYQLWNILQKASDGSTGYDDTPNLGGEYKVWVSTSSSFEESLSKTDNFKVTGGTTPPTTARLNVLKFYDANVNGLNDDGQLISGWKFRIYDNVDLIRYTPIDIILAPDDYTVFEFDPVETNWIHTTPVTQSVSLAAGDNKTVEFGNVCLGAGGGLTLGFWSNRNGQALIGSTDLAMLVALNLRKADGTPFDPAGYSDFRSWLLSANSTNMAYMLSAQLTAMELNVFNGFVSSNAIVYAPGTNSASSLGFASIGDLMTEANTELGLHGLTLSGSPYRTYQESLKNALYNANNNKSFVQSTPCPFSFL
jgi:hypothetical protein